jgi:hypothetical protein
MSARLIDFCDVWFDPAGSSSRLMAATTTPETPKEFLVQIAEGTVLHFRHIADIKGQRLFEATQQYSEHVGDQSLPVPMLYLSGPFRRVA